MYEQNENINKEIEIMERNEMENFGGEKWNNSPQESSSRSEYVEERINECENGWLKLFCLKSRESQFIQPPIGRHLHSFWLFPNNKQCFNEILVYL
jgi:hypothetical protein